MKSLNSILQLSRPRQNSDDGYIELLSRRGKTSAIYPPKLASEMICQDCGGNNGHTCKENGKRMWFCGNIQCLKIDTEITKDRERRVWWKNHQLSLKKSEEQIAKKKWDGN